MRRSIHRIAVVCIAIFCALTGRSAQADVLFSNNFGGLGVLTNPSTVSATFNAGAGAGSVTAQIAAYGTIDGPANPTFADYFRLSVNGSLVFEASWGFGGGGGPDAILTQPGGSVVSVNTICYFFCSNPPTLNGLADLDIPALFLDGSNTVVFEYYTGNPQTTADEGWGLNAVSISRVAAPEPASMTMLLSGLLGLGAIAKRRAR